MRRPSDPAIAVIVPFALLLLPVLYVLSVGPAWRLYYDGRISRRTFDAAYGPVVWLAKTTDNADLLLDYTILWKPRASIPPP